jgi:hypothetical protein
MVAAVNAPGWMNGNRVGQKAFVTVYVQGTLTPPATQAPVVAPVEAPATEEETPQEAIATVEAKSEAQKPLPFNEATKATVVESTETTNKDMLQE